MVTVSEVIVGLKSEGAADTKDDLDSVSDKTEETTAALDEQSDEMSDMAQSFSGALSAATVGLAAASAGLLSQVPVLGQVFDGLFAIVESVALAMDQVLRPVLQPLSNAFFFVAGAINETNGVVRDIIGVLGTIISIIGVVGGAAFTLGSGFATLSSIWSAIVTAGSAVVGILGTIAGAISLPAVAAAALVAALIGFIALMLTNFGGFRDKVISILSTIADKFVSGFKSFLEDPIGFVKNFIQSIIDLLFNTDWLALGGKVGSAIIGGLKDKLGLDGGDGFDFNTDDIMPDFETPDLGGDSDTGLEAFREQQSSMSFEDRKEEYMTVEDYRKQQQNQNNLPSQRDGNTQLFLNGREVGRGTNSERFDESARRGQTF